MPGKKLVDGSAYASIPGKPMVGGTVYTIKEGKTMVDGTAYSIKFASDVVVTITGSGNHKMAYVTINGTNYMSEVMITVPAGTEIYCYARYLPQKQLGGVYLNGTQLNVSEYTFNAGSDVLIVLDAKIRYGRAEITTT